jgi:hypothetical protein
MNQPTKIIPLPPAPIISRPWPDFPESAKFGEQYSTALQFGEFGEPGAVRITIEGRSPSVVDAYARLLNEPAARMPKGRRAELYPLHTLQFGQALTITHETDKERVFSVASEFGRRLGRKFSTRQQNDGTFIITRIS